MNLFPIPSSWQRRFLIAAGIILLVTGIAKLLTLTGDTTLLQVQDPFLGVEFRILIFLVGMAELVISALCLLTEKQRLNILLIAWIASGFLAYRIGIMASDWQRPCGCLGNLTDVLNISPKIADLTSMGMLGFLLIGSYSILYSNRFIAQKKSNPQPFSDRAC